MIYVMTPTLLYGFFKESIVVKCGLPILIYLDLRFTSSVPLEILPILLNRDIKLRKFNRWLSISLQLSIHSKIKT